MEKKYSFDIYNLNPFIFFKCLFKLKCLLSIFTNPSVRAGYDTRSISK